MTKSLRHTLGGPCDDWEMRRTRTALVLGAALVACRHEAPITADRDAAISVADAADDARDLRDASDASLVDADGVDAEGDGCVPGETWDARVRVRKTWHRDLDMMLPGPLELVIPRLGLQKAIYADCAITGGGCGDCTKPYSADMISCNLTPARVRVDIGIDDVGPTYVEVVQRGDTVIALWTHGAMSGGPGNRPPPTHSTEVLAKLPCAVNVRFVR